MVARWSQRAFPFLLFVLLVFLLASSAVAQRGGGGGGGGCAGCASANGMDGMGPSTDLGQAHLFFLDLNTQQIQKRHQQEEQPSEGVSKLDLKAPPDAKREYQKGKSLLFQKDFNGGVHHLLRALAIYPKFVAAHNALGIAYMDLGKNDKAREEFEQATVLDDHLPNSFSNLCQAELALQNYPPAEQAIKKASSLSPLNLDLFTTLIYAEFLNHNYQDAIATAHQVHEGKHEGAAMVHFLAAAAWREQKNLPEMEGELKTFLAEDPKSPSAEKARQLIARIDDIRAHPHVVTIISQQEPSPEMVAAEQEEKKQVAEAEGMTDAFQPDAPEPAATTADASSRPDPDRVGRGSSGWVLRKSVDEVALFFAATDHGKSVSDLTRQEVGIRDDHEPPANVIDFRNESELPLRLGLVIDTSASIIDRFSFEQGAAAGFLQKVLINKDDQAFVVGFSNSVLMVQDFTADQGQLSHAIGELAPAGGTALWDAVNYASGKLGGRLEPYPVAKILVVISDGNDNSSKTSLKQAIQAAGRGEVIVYTVSTMESTSSDSGPAVGDRALRVLAEQSGGSAFTPGSVSALKHSLAELQQVIRSRYMISYKPARVQADGHYRSIDINAQKSGHKLRVYARKGYYSRVDGDTSAKNF
jgi:Ca-activated chloride channel homolog